MSLAEENGWQLEAWCVLANQYPRCSAAWFERVASPAQVKTVCRFKTDRVNVSDDH